MTEDRIMKKKGFTLVEMITAIAVLVIIISFSSVIFKSSIDAYRVASAETEIMQKLRAITDTLNRDFENFQPDGRLIIKNEVKQPRKIYASDNDALAVSVRMDRIYYYAIGDFQSWYDPAVRSNAARIFLGHDANSLDDNLALSKCDLIRDVNLLTQGTPQTFDDSNGVYLSACTANASNLGEDIGKLLDNSFLLNINAPPPNNDVRRLLCENIGEFKIEWLDWINFYDPKGTKFIWKPDPTIPLPATPTGWNPQDIKPRALKFNFTLYDSKGIIKGGRRFSHIVYLGNRN